jgi:Tol biopolymer transport system component
LRCEVVHVSGGNGICLSADRGVFTTYAATLFDSKTFATHGTFALKGIPSRARVSQDGKLAALTVFVSGHGYTSLDFSTQTLLIDVASNAVRDDLETFSVTRDGAPLSNPDFNFWGVTFTPDSRNFYATLSTGGKHFLIRGDIAARSATVIHENVECPSLSPDARRVAYKKRVMEGDRVQWQLHVVDLASGRETALSEKRSIDDQLEWLDNRHVLYSVPSAADGSSPSTDVWEVAVDAGSAPRLFLPNAYSPAAARGGTP